MSKRRARGLAVRSLPLGSMCMRLTTAFTLTTGPILIAFAYKLGAPEIREHTSWWWQYVFVSVIAYSELKNIIVRVAQIRHILRQDEWVVTPRGHVDRTSTRT